MFEPVEISENMYYGWKLAFSISRFLGLSPFEINYHDNIYKISLSKKYLLVSYVFGVLLVVLTVVGLVNDLDAGKSSLKMTSTKTSVITFCDVFLILFIVVLGIFGTTFRLKSFWKFFSLLNDVDKLIKTNDGRRLNRSQSLKVKIIFSIIIFLLIYTMIVEDRNADGYFSVKNYIVFYFLYIIVFTIELLYWHIVECIGRRFKKLNECLEIGNENNKLFLKRTDINNKSLIFPAQNYKLFLNTNFKQLKIFEKHTINDNPTHINLRNTLNYSAIEFISKLSDAHGKLFEAVNVINHGFGFLSLIIIMSCLFHLVVTPYFLLLDLLIETTSLIPNLILQFLWVLTHFCRLLIIIEPCYATCEEAKNTNPLVAKMLCLNLEDYHKKQLQNFSLQLIHRNIEFSAFGLCSIDRPLLSAIAGAITTYLVILLQFR